MSCEMTRRNFVGSMIAGAAGTVLCGGCVAARRGMAPPPGLSAPRPAGLISPGCRGTKVRVGKLYAGVPGALWPTPKLDLKKEMDTYERGAFADSCSFRDVEFVGNRLITTAEQAREAAAEMKDVDGIVIVHLSMGIMPMVKEILATGKPTVLFAAPYSGHEWTGYGTLMNTPEGAMLDCLLTSDVRQIAAAVRPFRAVHHLREARILNVSAKGWPEDWVAQVREKFGTDIVLISRERVMAAYESIPESAARSEADRWIRQAVAVVEPPKDEIVRSCRLALAFEKLLDEEKATVITTDCYGTMYRQLPAFPCVGNVRLNNMGLGGICESDLRSALTHIIFQGLVGRPGFISDPTMDESTDGIILAHCLGSMKMDGPDGPSAPYKLRTIMERQEGCVPQVKMRVGQKVTQAIVVGTDLIPFFTGTIIDAPESDRGCRTKILVKVDGSPRKLWRQWGHCLHRVTCYGDLREDLERFCRFKKLTLVDEAA